MRNSQYQILNIVKTLDDVNIILKQHNVGHRIYRTQ